MWGRNSIKRHVANRSWEEKDDSSILWHLREPDAGWFQIYVPDKWYKRACRRQMQVKNNPWRRGGVWLVISTEKAKLPWIPRYQMTAFHPWQLTSFPFKCLAKLTHLAFISHRVFRECRWVLGSQGFLVKIKIITFLMPGVNTLTFIFCKRHSNI